MILLAVAVGVGLFQAKLGLSVAATHFIQQQVAQFSGQISEEVFLRGASTTLNQLSGQWKTLFPFVQDFRFGMVSQCEILLPLRHEGKFIQTLSVCFSQERLLIESLLSPQALVAFFVLLFVGLAFFFIQQKQQIQNQAVQEVLKEKELRLQLTKGLIHDLKSPLQALEMLSQILNLETESGTFLSHAILRLQSLVKELNDQSVQEKADSRNHSKATRVQTLNDLISEFEHREPQILWIRSRQEVEGISLDLRLSRLFQNLFENAIEAQATRLHLDIKLKQTGMLIQVSDNGVGLSSEQAQFLGQQPLVSSKKNGSGKGLFLLLQELKKYQIEVKFFSELNEGMIVQISIPENYLTSFLNFQSQFVLKG